MDKHRSLLSDGLGGTPNETAEIGNHAALSTWLMTGSATIAQEPEFRYDDQQSWGGSCQTGTKQSPVSLAFIPQSSESPLTRRAQYSFSYGDYPLGAEIYPLGAEIAHNAVRIDAPRNPAYGFRFALDATSRDFRLVQVHFHVPAEHSLRAGDGPETTFALEAHLVHEAADGTKAVLAVLFEEGAPNHFLTALVSDLPTRGNPTRRTDRADLRMLLPTTTQIYLYSGSLTTPGCNEGIIWHVARTRMTASPEQIRALRAAVGFANNRRQARRLVTQATQVVIWSP
jgi:carbonic anhydrase